MKTYRVLWSPLAEKTYLKTLSQIFEYWTYKEASDFEAKVESLIVKLTYHNFLCPSSKTQKNLRRCVITPQTSMVYQVKDDIIEIVAFFDNRSRRRF